MKSLKSKQNKAKKAHARRKDYEKKKLVNKYAPKVAVPYEKKVFAQKKKWFAEQTWKDGKPVSKMVSEPVKNKDGSLVLEQVGVKIKHYKIKRGGQKFTLPKSRKFKK